MARGTTVALDEALGLNEVRVRGRLSAEPELRELPSGDAVVVFRLVVGREGTTRVDTLDCAAFRGDVRRKAARWAPGDVVEVEGALRRRFFRAGGVAASRYEIEVQGAARVRRGAG